MEVERGGQEDAAMDRSGGSRREEGGGRRGRNSLLIDSCSGKGQWVSDVKKDPIYAPVPLEET
eukprot:763360-Hanusia_phi.AAC.2